MNALVFTLVGLAVALQWLCVFGLLVMRNPFDRLHAIAPAAIVPPFLIALACLAANGFSIAAAKAFFIALVLLASGPIMTHALARAARLREEGAIFPEKK
jgi:multisubunit Na+/H+ antiporter MnhG subunit